MRAALFTLAWVAFLGVIIVNGMRLEAERDRAVRRAEQAEADAARLLDVINGKAAFVEIKPNGDRVYTTFKTRTVTVKPLVMAEAQ